MVPERNACRRAFIAACDAAHIDPIARVHPGKAADGRPLFMDSVALGPRLATKALLILTDDPRGSDLIIGLLQAGIALPPDARLVLVHALDPPAFVGQASDPAWSATMLAAVVREDLAKVTRLAVLDLTALDLRTALPKAADWITDWPTDPAAWV